MIGARYNNPADDTIAIQSCVSESPKSGDGSTAPTHLDETLRKCLVRGLREEVQLKISPEMIVSKEMVGIN